MTKARAIMLAQGFTTNTMTRLYKRHAASEIPKSKKSNTDFDNQVATGEVKIDDPNYLKKMVKAYYREDIKKEHTEEELVIKFYMLVTFGLGVIIFILGLIVGYIARG